ncbi:SGNH hydrolase [Phyllosticta capitalensis]|uniref:SGNH hydrolase n=1 Tax=Phyllosticta capitalensis TaxID=121624 RepID=A0ABR1YV66_9PEZI
MKYSVPASVLALAASTSALPATKQQAKHQHAKRATPKVWLAGDSTMASGGGGSGTQGWGEYLQYSLSATVENVARAGRSARSYTDEGRFDDIADQLSSGDIVVIEFGHNDGGSLSETDNGRTDCYGDGDETCTTPDGLTVQTFVTYVTNAGKTFVEKGATVIVSSQTPNNPWEEGDFAYSGSRFVEYAQTAAANIGDGAFYVDHGQYTANIFESLGKDAVDAYFPNDHTHTSPEGADHVAKAFVKGVLCGGDSDLVQYVTNSTSSVEGSCV